ncbi:MaoC/PaaZ C-terminal domain-containing protein [Utexia brackfieldae]|uniref:MaoC/PaaZ C-terminal domain-containing protein n=1 Tax=Utexia brackfieldae TaxID=3074108 RepID=UPI00370D13C0
MIKSYSQQDIGQWAYFSGDYNQVHFDRAIAHKNGLADIIVQGMLVMMAAKLKLADQIKGDSRLNFYLKQPVYLDEPVQYQYGEKNQYFFNKIIKTSSVQEAITAKLSNQQSPIFATPAHKIAISADFFQTQSTLFRQTYPQIQSNWLLMDALLFSVCFKYQHGEPYYQKALKITSQPDKSKVVTYQTDQKIYIPARLLSDREIDVSKLSAYFEDKDIIQQDDSVYSLLDYQVMEGDQLLYQSSMGSITKAQLD